MKWRGRHVGMLTAGVVLLAGLTAFGVIQYKDKQNYKTFLANVYERAFHEAAGYVDDVNNLLTKLDAVERPEQSAPLFAELWRQAAAAHTQLSMLPYTVEMVAETQRYLAQVSDFSYAMMLKTIDGNALDDIERENLATVKSFAAGFADELASMVNQASVGGGVRWEELAAKSGQKAESETVSNVPPQILLGSLENVTRTFQEYPELMYDGPFSDHIQNMKPRMTEGREMITQAEGRRIVLDLLAAADVLDVVCIGETPAESSAVIPVFSYEARLRGQAEAPLYIDVTKQGGLPLWMLHGAAVPQVESPIALPEAVGYADAFLRQAGLADMKYSYYEHADGCIVINYAPVEGGVLMYPDLVKVKVSAADGRILGFEALGYVMMHGPRIVEPPALSVSDAMTYVSPKLAIMGSQLAVIPVGSYRELLCYEFRASNGDDEFLIYINADTGKMEKIFEMIISEYGVLVQ